MVMLLFAVLISIFSRTLMVGIRSWTLGHNRSQLVQTASTTLGMLSRDISEAQNFDAAAANAVTFIADHNGDGTVETITYDMGTDFLRKQADILAPQVSVAQNVQAIAFSYRDLNGTTITAPVVAANLPAIRLVDITLTMLKGSETVVMKTSVFCRNR